MICEVLAAGVDVGATAVVATFFGGKQVYGQLSASEGGAPRGGQPAMAPKWRRPPSWFERWTMAPNGPNPIVV